MRRCSRLLGRALVLSCALLIAACASETRPGAKQPETVTQSINLSGYPPEFRKGYTEGCSAARRNNPSGRPKGDSQYAVGWSDGFDYCKAKK